MKDIIVDVDLTEESYDVELIQPTGNNIFSKGFSKAMLLRFPVFSQVDIEINPDVLIGVNDTKFYKYNNESNKIRVGQRETTLQIENLKTFADTSNIADLTYKWEVIGDTAKYFKLPSPERFKFLNETQSTSDFVKSFLQITQIEGKTNNLVYTFLSSEPLKIFYMLDISTSKGISTHQVSNYNKIPGNIYGMIFTDINNRSSLTIDNVSLSS